MAQAPVQGAVGKIAQIQGVVVDVEFPPDQLPEIYNALAVQVEEGVPPLILEVQQHLGNDWVRCVSMSSTEGVRRGLDAVDTGQPIQVPVGPATLGRIFNVVGVPVDNAGPVSTEIQYPIHRESPSFEDQST